MVFEILTWWYLAGWRAFIEKLRGWLSGITDFFSMGSLIRTLFKPFRQISADSADANSSLDLRFHMFVDRLISRIVGFFSRLILLAVGCFFIIFGGAFSLLLILLWPLIPLFPVAGVFLFFLGVTL